MGRYSDGLQRYLNRDDLSLKTSGAEGASTTSTAHELGDKTAMSLTVDVSAASGSSPTMTVVIEGSDDGTNWHTLATFGSDGYRVGSVGTAPANFITTGTVRGTVPAARFVRSRSVIGGSGPSFTYSVGGSSA